jgi:hypothetical protein
VAQLSTFGDIASFLFPKHAYALHMLSICEYDMQQKFVDMSINPLIRCGLVA